MMRSAPVSVPRIALGLIRAHPWAIGGLLLLMMASSGGQLAALGALYPVLQIITTGRPAAEGRVAELITWLSGRPGLPPSLGLNLIVLIAVTLAYAAVAWFTDARVAQFLRAFEMTTRMQLVESAVRADWTYLRALRHGEFINVVTREAELNKVVVKYCLHTMSALLHGAALLVWAVWVSWQMSLIGLGVLALGGLALAPLFAMASRLGHETTAAFSQLSGRLVNALRASKAVKALSLEDYLLGVIRPSIEGGARAYFRQEIVASTQTRIAEVFSVVAIGAMLYVGSVFFNLGSAVLLLVLLAFFRLVPQVRAGIDSYHRARAALASVAVVQRHRSAAAAARGRMGGRAVPSAWQSVEFRDVMLAYDGAAPVVDGLSFRLRRGDFMAILGPTGSGKTTVLDLLLGLVLPQRGQVLVDGVPTEEFDPVSWHAQIGYLGQDVFVFEGTLRSNILWGADRIPTDDELRQALAQAQLAGRRFGSLALETEILEHGQNMSGGEKQRVALARTFLRRPALMILDEPTTGLDVQTERQLMQAISALRGVVTVILVTHREELARTADVRVEFTPSGIMLA